jgi:hypothetical protein
VSAETTFAAILGALIGGGASLGATVFAQQANDERRARQDALAAKKAALLIACELEEFAILCASQIADNAHVARNSGTVYITLPTCSPISDIEGWHLVDPELLQFASALTNVGHVANARLSALAGRATADQAAAGHDHAAADYGLQALGAAKALRKQYALPEFVLDRDWDFPELLNRTRENTK